MTQKDFGTLCWRKIKNRISTPEFTKESSHNLLDRIKNIQLYAHSYSFTLHFNYSDFQVTDLLKFAHGHSLSGIDVHITFGDKKSLSNKGSSELEEIETLATELNLKIALETSSTTKHEINKVVKIAKILNAQNIRVYNRYNGRLSEIVQKGIKDLRYASKIADKNNLYFVIEQHEVLKSYELAYMIQQVDSPRIGLLFDFGNMINANESPLSALKTMSPYIWQVHIKDIRIMRKKQGFAQKGVSDGEGDLQQQRMLFELLKLGNSKPQVKIFALEQVNGYYAPPYRFSKEEKDPIIPGRKPSNTCLNPKISVNENLRVEYENANDQIIYIRNLLNELKKNPIHFR